MSRSAAKIIAVVNRLSFKHLLFRHDVHPFFFANEAPQLHGRPPVDASLDLSCALPGRVSSLMLGSRRNSRELDSRENPFHCPTCSRYYAAFDSSRAIS